MRFGRWRNHPSERIEDVGYLPCARIGLDALEEKAVMKPVDEVGRPRVIVIDDLSGIPPHTKLVGVGWSGISPETIESLRAIDQKIRDAAIHAHKIYMD